MFKIGFLILCISYKIHADVCQFKCNANNPLEVDIFGEKLLCQLPEKCNKHNIIDKGLCKPCLEDPLCGACNGEDIVINGATYGCPQYLKCDGPTGGCAKCKPSCDKIKSLKCDSLTTGSISGAFVNCTEGLICNANIDPPCDLCISKPCKPKIYECDLKDPALVIIPGAESITCDKGKICNENNVQPCTACIPGK